MITSSSSAPILSITSVERLWMYNRSSTAFRWPCAASYPAHNSTGTISGWSQDLFRQLELLPATAFLLSGSFDAIPVDFPQSFLPRIEAIWEAW